MKLNFGVEFFDAIILSENQLDDDLNKFRKGFELSHIKPIDRRRLSQCAKCAFSLLKPFKELNMSVVYSSYLNEINRYFQLQESLAKKEPISPLSFSLSVHNALCGLLAIEYKNHSEISAISAYCVMENALLQAYLRLKYEEKVLCIGYAEALNQSYFKTQAPTAMVAMILTRGNDFSLSFSKNKSGKKNDEPLLNFITNFPKKRDFECSDDVNTWRYEC